MSDQNDKATLNCDICNRELVTEDIIFQLAEVNLTEDGDTFPVEDSYTLCPDCEKLLGEKIEELTKEESTRQATSTAHEA